MASPTASVLLPVPPFCDARTMVCICASPSMANRQAQHDFSYANQYGGAFSIRVKPIRRISRYLMEGSGAPQSRSAKAVSRPTRRLQYSGRARSMLAMNERPGNAMRHSHLVTASLAIAVAAIGAGGAAAQDAVKIGLVMPMTGTVASTGQDVVAAAQLYIAQHGDRVAGKKIELIVRDDASLPDNAKRLAQEMIVNDKVSFLGANITPSAMSMAPIATEGKVATIVMVSGTSVVTERSPYYVRTSFTLGQQSGIIADWAIKNGSKKVVAILSD